MSAGSQMEISSLEGAVSAAILALQLNNLEVVSENNLGFSYQIEVGRCGGPTALLDVRYAAGRSIYTVHGDNNEMKRVLSEMFKS